MQCTEHKILFNWNLFKTAQISPHSIILIIHSKIQLYYFRARINVSLDLIISACKWDFAMELHVRRHSGSCVCKCRELSSDIFHIDDMKPHKVAEFNDYTTLDWNKRRDWVDRQALCVSSQLIWRWRPLAVWEHKQYLQHWWARKIFMSYLTTSISRSVSSCASV